MITIAWYNVVAIIVGIAFVVFFVWNANKDTGSGMLAGIGEALLSIIMFFTAVAFFAIWGGIFWW